MSEEVVVENNNVETPATQRLYTKEEVQALMKKRVERSHQAFFDRYGVKNLEELDALYEDGENYKSSLAEMQLKNAELVKNNAFSKNNINPDRYEDINTYYKGTGTEFSEENLLEVLKTHPEWVRQPEAQTTTIQSLGSEAHVDNQPNELEIAGKLLGVDF